MYQDRLQSGFLSNASGEAALSLSTLTAAAITLQERLELRWYYGAQSAPGSNSFFATWREFLADEDGTRLARRLAWDNWTKNSAAAAVSVPPPPEALQDLPWIASARELWTEADSGFRRFAEARPLPSPHPLPFFEAYVPLLAWAAAKLPELPYFDFSKRDRSSSALLKQLAGRLSYLSAQTLYLEFATTLPRNSGASPRGGRKYYERFVSKLARGGWKGIFARYPMLWRLMATVIANWRESTEELARRFGEDRAELLAHRLISKRRIVDVRAAGDAHHHGRAVQILTFADGRKVVYKPRELAAECACNALLDRLNAAAKTRLFLTPRDLARPDYGWIEFITADRSAAGIPAGAFRRFGHILAVAHALGMGDLHHENVILHRGFPVPVDLEVIFQPDPRGDRSIPMSDAQHAARRRYLDSTAQMVLLPPAFDARPARERMIAVGRWKEMNTDHMRLVRAKLMPDEPGMLGTKLTPENVDLLRAAFDAGFASAYRIIAARRDLVDECLDELTRHSSRYLFRHTSAYSAILERATDPRSLRDSSVFSLELEALCAPSLDISSKPGHWDLIAGERRALLQGDIPSLAICGGSLGISVGGEAPLELFKQPPVITAKARVLSEDDLEAQRGVIVAAFCAAVRRPAGHMPRRKASPATSRENFVAEAVRLGERLESTAIRAEDGSAAWIGYCGDARRGGLVLQDVDLSLYEGVAGIAVFLASLARVTGESRFAALAGGAVKTIREGAKWDEAGIGCGVARGAASHIIASDALEKLGFPCFSDAELTQLGDRLTGAVSTSNEPIDLLNGLPGALLGMLRLVARFPGNETFKNSAAEIARRIAAVGDSGSLGTLLGGFSHGAAGAAYALAKYRDVMPACSDASAALAALELQHGLLNARFGLWRDRRTKHGGYLRGWCHGAAGIGAAYSSLLTGGAPGFVRHGYEAALRAVLSGEEGLDCPCCGRAGMADFLITEALKNGDLGLLQKARSTAGDILRERERRGFYHCFEGVNSDLSSFGYFQGIAGIGALFLRCASVTEVPSLLFL